MTDRSFAWFEPDTLLPSQFYAAFRGSTGAEGSRRLMLAVLRDALECYQKYAFARDVHGRQLFEEAQAWILAEERGWYFSFANICETLNIDIDYVRSSLENWRRRSVVLPRYPEPQPPPEFDDAPAAAAG